MTRLVIEKTDLYVDEVTRARLENALPNAEYWLRVYGGPYNGAIAGVIYTDSRGRGGCNFRMRIDGTFRVMAWERHGRDESNFVVVHVRVKPETSKPKYKPVKTPSPITPKTPPKEKEKRVKSSSAEKPSPIKIGVTPRVPETQPKAPPKEIERPGAQPKTTPAPSKRRKQPKAGAITRYGVGIVGIVERILECIEKLFEG